MDFNQPEIVEKLSSLKEKGYIKVAFSVIKYEDFFSLDLLMIHSSWQEYSFHSQFDQCLNDLKKILPKELDYSLEIPTKDMYLHHRQEDAPIQEIVVFDLI